MWLGTLLLLPGLIIGLRFIVHYVLGSGSGHIQSLILAAVLILTAVIVFVAGVITDLIAANRVLLEEVRTRLLRAEVERAVSAEASNDAAQARVVRLKSHAGKQPSESGG